MTHIPSQTAHDHDIDAFINGIDPKTMRDARHLREVSAARTSLERAESQLVDAVRAARTAGDSWTMIGIALRTSKQNAHRKFAGLLGEAEQSSQPKVTKGQDNVAAEAIARTYGARSDLTDEDYDQNSKFERDDKSKEVKGQTHQ